MGLSVKKKKVAVLFSVKMWMADKYGNRLWGTKHKEGRQGKLTGTSTYLAAAFTFEEERGEKKKNDTEVQLGRSGFQQITGFVCEQWKKQLGVRCFPEQNKAATHCEREDWREECAFVVSGEFGEDAVENSRKLRTHRWQITVWPFQRRPFFCFFKHTM